MYVSPVCLWCACVCACLCVFVCECVGGGMIENKTALNYTYNLQENSVESVVVTSEG